MTRGGATDGQERTLSEVVAADQVETFTRLYAELTRLQAEVAAKDAEIARVQEGIATVAQEIAEARTLLMFPNGTQGQMFKRWADVLTALGGSK